MTDPSPRTQAWFDFCRADERATQILVDHVNAGGQTPCEDAEYEAAVDEATQLYRQYRRLCRSELS